MALGIAFDIGAYSCKAAIIRGETVEPNPLLYGENMLRSVVYVDSNNKIIVGERAIRKAAIGDPKRAFFDVKRRILRGARELPGIPELTYLDLYVAIVKEAIKRCTEQLQKNGDTFDHVVLTVPSFIEDRENIIADMKRAAESIVLANGKNLSVELLVEPAGVAIHNINTLNKNGSEHDGRYAKIFYDLGHSTLDVALVSVDNNKGYTSTLHRFWPDDETSCAFFDDCIAKEIREMLENEGVTITNRVNHSIYNVAAELKHTLSTHEEHTVLIEHDDTESYFTLTRAQFEELVINSLRDSATLVSDALAFAESKEIQVNEIILAGGGSNIPVVERCIREIAGDIPVKRSLNPLDAASFGASRYCLAHDLKQATKFAYGIQIPATKGTIERKVHIMAPEHSALPFESTKQKKLHFVCNRDGVFLTTLYSHTDAKSGQLIDADECKQIRHMSFEIAPYEPISVLMEIDEEHCVKIICETDNNERYVMTNFDPANAVSRKE